MGMLNSIVAATEHLLPLPTSFLRPAAGCTPQRKVFVTDIPLSNQRLFKHKGY